MKLKGLVILAAVAVVAYSVGSRSGAARDEHAAPSKKAARAAKAKKAAKVKKAQKDQNDPGMKKAGAMAALNMTRAQMGAAKKRKATAKARKAAAKK